MEQLIQDNSNGRKRHQLTHEAVEAAVAQASESTLVRTARKREDSPIKTIAQLRTALCDALALELSTIPPYLCALYSIREGSNREASAIIRSIVVEEMLHMIMVANLLNAIDQRPSCYEAGLRLHYPGPLPRIVPSFEVGLLPFSKPAIDTFMRIELPDADAHPAEGDTFYTIGQFYNAIRIGMTELEKAARHKGETIFTGNPALQVQAAQYYGSGGQIVEVRDLQSALLVIAEIEGQGEGVDGTIIDTDSKLFGEGIEYAHYFRFKEVREERYYCENDGADDPPSGKPLPVDWSAVLPMKANPVLKDYAAQPEVHAKAVAFNRLYADLLLKIDAACNGQPEKLQEGIAVMYALKYAAQELMHLPIGDGVTAGPTFELQSTLLQ